jgi:polyisoprenoid-binding protein YceI
MKKLILAAASLVLLGTGLLAQDKKIVVDRNHTQIGFKAATFLFSVPGRFQKWDIKWEGDPSKPEGGKVTASIDVASINTGITKRDEHLRSDAFFDAAKYPKITFTSSKVWNEGGKLMVAGTLDMHGVKKDLTLPFEAAAGKNGSGNDSWSYQATTTINRKDFGVGSESVGAAISLKDNVELNLGFVVYAEEVAAPAAKKMSKPARKKAA